MELASPQSARPRRRIVRYTVAAAGLLVAGGAAHLWYLTHNCPLDLSGDEAHYWEWARRLDWSYYSKGPLVAYIIAAARWLLAAWSERMVGNEALAVRIPAILLSVGTGCGVYLLALRTLHEPHLALATVAILFTMPVLAVGAVLMTIDAPLAFLYVWALIALARAVHTDRLWPWIVAGILIALGILAKYTMMLIFPAVGLALVIEPVFRQHWRRPGPYVATALGLLGWLPILAWNARHSWVSLRHVAGQAGIAGSHTWSALGPLELVAGQLAVVNPVWLVCMVGAVVALWRRPAPQPPETHATALLSLLLCATATPWLAFLAFSPLTKIQPNWPVLAVLPGSIVLVGWLARLLRGAQTRRAARGLIAAGVILGAAGVAAAHFGHALTPVFAWLARREPPWNLTPTAKYDPTARLRGWAQLGAAVGRTRAHLPADAFIITDDYQTASEIAFYCPGEPSVYCLQAALGDRQSQYDIWPNPIRDAARFVGRPCIYVGTLKPGLTGQTASGHVTLPDVRRVATVEHRLRGHLIRVWPIYVCDDFLGLPPELSNPLPRY